MGSIRVLSDRLVNKIAAGEVVERPASVVKELLENALDAGSSRVRIETENGGRRRIVVEDNGSGMDSDDLLQALERHATSKISSTDDLFSISTLGFRGEALPSIGAVSRLTLSSRLKGAPGGNAVVVAGGKYVGVNPCGLFEGTRVEVERLFYNVPARRKFLRSPETELTHIVTLVENYALSRPDVAFFLSNNGREIVNLASAADRRSRFFDLFPDLPREDFREVDFTTGDLSVRGLAAVPERNFSSARYQFVLVNGRFVRDRLVRHAVTQAYENTHPKGRYPPLFLSISLPLEKVDVNVHPAKMEVRFVESHRVHEAVVKALRTVLFEENAPSAGRAPHENREGLSGTSVFFKEEAGSYFGSSVGDTPETHSPVGGTPVAHLLAAPGESAVSSESACSPFRAIAQWRASFILCDCPQGLAVVDQHVAHERLRFEQFRRFINDPGARQPFLIPPVYKLPRTHAHRAGDMALLLESQGFEAEALDEGRVAVRSAPAFLKDSEKDYLLTDFFDSAGEVLKTPRERWREVLVMRSCRGAVMANEPLPLEKLQYLLDTIHSMGAPLTCPHGRPMVYVFEDREILSRFLR